MVSLLGSDYKIHFSSATIINLVFLIPIGYFISHEIRTVYFNPRVRWWEQSKRFLHEIKVEVEGKAYSTFDLSETGAFIVDTKELNLEMNEIFPVVIDIDDKKISCFAEVRWLNDQKGKYPAGYGIKFD
ncbi:MAG TPA: PilZ domain-containing protein, partial [Spirochaetota bacterium]|nr:PilZ domain-containing protein [Spirochaetota bacterium]